MMMRKMAELRSLAMRMTRMMRRRIVIATNKRMRIAIQKIATTMKMMMLTIG